MSRFVAFLGPSLPASEARRLCPGIALRPPAARGDVARATRQRPRAIALIDGVFEARPSVWHREILMALEEGVAVFGAASMGALRAAELWPFGMVGVGDVYRQLREGTLCDDSEVALLHASAEHGYRALTVPLVTVRAAAAAAKAARALRPAEARALVDVATAIFYQERAWPGLLSAFAQRSGLAARQRLTAFLARGAPDPKADDARACLVAASAFARHRPLAPPPPRWPPASPLVRARLGAGPGEGVESALARQLGLTVTADELFAEGARRSGTVREREAEALARKLRHAAPRLIAGYSR